MTCYAWWCRGDVCEHPRVGFYVEMDCDGRHTGPLCLPSNRRAWQDEDVTTVRQTEKSVNWLTTFYKVILNRSSSQVLPPSCATLSSAINPERAILRISVSTHIGCL